MTGESIFYTLVNLGYKVAPFDQRKISEKIGTSNMNRKIIDDVNELEPDLVLIIKGAEISPTVIRLLKSKRKVAIWNFDVTTLGENIPDSKYLDHIKSANYFFTSMKGYVEQLKEKGVNAYWLQSACDPKKNGEVVYNYYQEKTFGGEVAFIGNIGSNFLHPTRMEILEFIIENGFNLKIFGNFIDKDVSKKIEEKHTQYAVTNDFFSIVCQTTKIIVGIDAHPEIEQSQSARLYRVLCAGGFYLTNNTKGLTDSFKDGVHLVIYKNKEDLIEKLIYYLTHDEERAKIAKAGQLEVMKHTWEIRLKEMMAIINAN